MALTDAPAMPRKRAPPRALRGTSALASGGRWRLRTFRSWPGRESDPAARQHVDSVRYSAQPLTLLHRFSRLLQPIENLRRKRQSCRMRPWVLQALSAVAWVQSTSLGEHPQSITDCNDVACVSASSAGEMHRQTRIGAILAEAIRAESPQYICADNSKRTRCPTVAAQLGASPLNLTIPSHARWLFEGPSYTQEIYDTLVAANGGCRTSRGRRLSATEPDVLIPPRDEREQANNEADSKGPTYDSHDACHLPNGAVVAYLNGELVRGFVRNHAWTHGFFMQPHNKKYRIEHERAAAERDDVDEKAFADTQVCHSGLVLRTSRLLARPQSHSHATALQTGLLLTRLSAPPLDRARTCACPRRSSTQSTRTTATSRPLTPTSSACGPTRRARTSTATARRTLSLALRASCRRRWAGTLSLAAVRACVRVRATARLRVG